MQRVSDSTFIDIIFNQDSIWNKKNPDYRNLEKKTKVWAKVAKCCNMNVLNCQRKWKFIREKYRRERIYLEKYRNGNATNPKEIWNLMDKLIFLDEVYQPRGTYGNVKKYIPSVTDGNHLKNEMIISPISPTDDTNDYDDDEDFWDQSNCGVDWGYDGYDEGDGDLSKVSHIDENTIISVESTNDGEMKYEQITQDSRYTSLGKFVGDTLNELQPDVAERLEIKIMEAVLEAKRENMSIKRQM